MENSKGISISIKEVTAINVTQEFITEAVRKAMSKHDGVLVHTNCPVNFVTDSGGKLTAHVEYQKDVK